MPADYLTPPTQLYRLNFSNVFLILLRLKTDLRKILDAKLDYRFVQRVLKLCR